MKLPKAKITTTIIFDIVVVLLVFAAPYYIFEGKLFIGGDETRLQYIYPLDWITKQYLFSWYGYSPVGTFNPLQYTIPFLSLFTVLDFLIPSKTVVNYLAFSTPLALGYVFFKKLVNELDIIKSQFTLSVGSLVYVLSPILLYKIVNPFLFATWLVGYLPLLGFLLARYTKTGKRKYVLINVIVSIFLAVCFNSIPWILGAFLPLIVVSPLTFLLFSKKELVEFVKRSLVFVIFLTFSQSFWLASFVTSMFFSTGSYTASILAENIKSSFETTVLATSGGNNILFPFLNLFHREIAFVSNWPLKDLFLKYYDYFMYLNIIFPATVFIAALNFRTYLKTHERKFFILSLVTFLFALFFFTVNIGPLKSVFLWMGNIPGFVMFRNFYGKFSLGYTIFFAIAFTLSLEVVVRKFRDYSKVVLYTIIVVIVANTLPIKQVINIPLWKSDNIYTTINLPQEYLDFMKEVDKQTPSTTTILSIPLNIASYSIVKEDNSTNIFAGSSTTKLFADIPAYSGDLSFSSSFGKSKVALNINKLIQERDYETINDFIDKHNIGYVMETKNIPEGAKLSYIFNRKTLPYQDQDFINAITEKKLYESSKGNYVLYKTKYNNTILTSNNLYFKKVSPVKYKLYMQNISEPQDVMFLNTLHTGWKLFLEESPKKEWCNQTIYFEDKNTTVCEEHSPLIDITDISYSFSKSIFSDSQDIYNDFANKWTIDKDFVKENYDKSFYKENSDGSIDIEMTLYFVPQNFFYFGSIISIFTILGMTAWVFKKRK